MGSLSKSHVWDAGKRKPEMPRSVSFKGERRAERFPSGVVERFVDLQGNVVQCQLLSPGLAMDRDAINRARSQLHLRKSGDGSVVGFIEHDKCPMRHAVRFRHPVTEEEFASMPAELQQPCDCDPSPGRRTAKGIEYNEGCKHIQWIIASRAQREAERRASRRGNQVSVVELERQKLEVARQQADEQRKANERLLQLAEQQAGTAKTRKAPTE